MDGLSIDMFVRADQDFESAQYRILGGLKEMRDAFTGNVIYPHLRSLIDLHSSLHSVLENLDSLRSAGPRRATGIDLDQASLIYESEPTGNRELGFVEDLIQWALPLIREAIEEGRTIFEFVDEHLVLEEVGIVPPYVQEGYFIVPDRMGSRLHVLQYSLSIFTKADERFRTLRTTTVKTVEQWSIALSPSAIKLDLLREKRDLPNPATFVVDFALDFPYEDTVLPVAKRKLLRHLSLMEGLA
ncbi:MAG TPA: hypothetical protein VF190_11620 [Rhodothermales bacterium]